MLKSCLDLTCYRISKSAAAVAVLLLLSTNPYLFLAILKILILQRTTRDLHINSGNFISFRSSNTGGDINNIIRMASDIRPPSEQKTGRVREKVVLQPGFHLMDWMRLMDKMTRLSGTANRKISLQELSEHSSEYDCWTAYKGKVYNITQYLPYHPGGKKILMQGAGKDSTDLFDKYHKWVNIASILTKCDVGILMSDEPITEDDEDCDDDDDAAAADEDDSINMGNEKSVATDVNGDSSVVVGMVKVSLTSNETVYDDKITDDKRE